MAADDAHAEIHLILCTMKSTAWFAGHHVYKSVWSPTTCPGEGACQPIHTMKLQ